MKEKKTQIFARLWDLPYGRTTPYNLFAASKNSKDFVQKFQLERKIPVHNGCVNSIAWNENGKYLLSGSDDQHLSIVQGHDYSVLAYIPTGHRSNIFSAKFLPCSGDSRVVSSSGDGIIIYSDLERPDTSMINKFTCHKATTYEIITVPSDPNTFLSCGEDRTVRWFDLRTKTSCSIENCKNDVLISCPSPVTAIAVNPLIPYQLAVGCADSSVQIFDRRMMSTQTAAACRHSNGLHALMSYFTVPDFPRFRRITSLCYSPDGREMLVSYSSDYIYLFDIKDDMGKNPKFLSAADPGSYDRTRPLLKRLRVRGDWSDTGPNSRPEAEPENIEQENSPHTIVRRMTHVLSRMLCHQSEQRDSEVRSTASSSSEPSLNASSNSEDGDADVTSNPNNEEAERNNPQAGTSSESNNSQVSQTNEMRGTVYHTGAGTVYDYTAAGTSLAANNSAFEQTNLESQSSSSLDLPSTSGLQSIPKSSTVIKHTVFPTDNSELPEPTPSTSSSYQVECESILPERKSSEALDSTDGSDNASEQVSSENASIPHSSVSLPSIEVPETSAGTGVNNPPTERSSESETDAAVQTIQQNENLPIVSEIQSLRIPSSPSSDIIFGELMSPRSPSPDVPQENNNEEAGVRMEVDSWDSDSDDGSQAGSSQSNRRRRPRQVRSLYDELDSDQQDEVNSGRVPKHVTRPRVKNVFKGHRNARTMIKESTFWGDNFVMSGSDCGHIFIWDRHTTELVMIMEGDHHVVNCLQPHPFDPILASSGIDYDIKIWAPLREEPFFDVEKANEIVKRNEIMLEVTKDTITVPASFMFNMFNTLRHLTSGQRRLHRWRQARADRAADSSNR